MAQAITLQDICVYLCVVCIHSSTCRTRPEKLAFLAATETLHFETTVLVEAAWMLSTL